VRAPAEGEARRRCGGRCPNGTKVSERNASGQRRPREVVPSCDPPARPAVKACRCAVARQPGRPARSRGACIRSGVGLGHAVADPHRSRITQPAREPPAPSGALPPAALRRGTFRLRCAPWSTGRRARTAVQRHAVAAPRAARVSPAAGRPASRPGRSRGRPGTRGRRRSSRCPSSLRSSGGNAPSAACTGPSRGARTTARRRP
jgi:hypothetical protein